MASYSQGQYSVSSSYYNYFLSQVPEGKDYIIFSTSSDYICIYGDFDGNKSFDDSTVISIARSNANGRVTFTDESSSTFTINYPYYAYSDVGVGTYLSRPQSNDRSLQQLTWINVILFVTLLVTIGFSIIKKRWIL